MALSSIAFCLTALIALPALIGCTASKPVRIPVPDAYELASGPYHIELKSGKTHKAARILVSNDSAFFRDQAVPLKAIHSIEIRSFSPLKTAGLVVGTGLAAFTLFVAYILVLISIPIASRN